MVATLKQENGRVGSFNTTDWYSFTLTSAQDISIDLTTASVSATYGSATVYLYGTNSNNPIAYDSGSVGSDGWINGVIAAGTYFVAVQSNYETSYSLNLGTGVTPVGTASSNYAGTSLAGARSLGIIGTAPVSVAEWVGSGNADDWYSFNVSSVSSLKITLSGLSNSAQVYLKNASGQTIQSSSGSAYSNASLLDAIAPLTPGNYYIDVEGSSTGYNLQVAATPIPESAGNSISSARDVGTLVAAGTSVSDTLNNADLADYYKFELSSNATVTLALTGLVANATLTLYNAAGAALESTSAGLNGAGWLTDDLAPLSAGLSYYIGVSYSSGVTTPYTVSAYATPYPSSAGTTSATATAVGPLSGTPQTYSAKILPLTPYEYYTFTLSAVTTVNIGLTTYNGTTAASADLQVYNSSSSQIGDEIISTSGQNSGETMTLQPGTYTARVTNYYSGDEPTYKVSFSSGAIPVGTSAVNSAGTSVATAVNLATPTSTGTTYTDWVGTADPSDYYKFTLTSPSIVSLTLSGMSNSNSLYLLDAAGNTITSTSGSSPHSNNGVTTTDYTSLVDVLAAGTYYTDVTTNSSGTGYSLAVAATPIPDAAGNGIGSALNIGTLGTNVLNYSDYVGAVDRDDYYQFTLSTASTVNALLSGLTASETLYLRDISGNTLYSASGLSGQQTNASIIASLAPNSYFIDVESSGSPSTYNLSLYATPINSPGGATQGTATPLGLVNSPSDTTDFNQDGKSDLLLQNDAGNIVMAAQSNLAIAGTVAFSNPGPTWHVVASADLNGDGQADLLLQNDNGSVVSYLLNGYSLGSASLLGSPASSWHVRGTGDFNGDGKSDILLQNDNGTMVVWGTNGYSVSTVSTVGTLPSGWTVEGVADFNGDGHPDILVESTSGVLVDYTMNGTSITSASQLGSPGAGWSVAGTGDYNNDGNADIILHNDNGSNVLWETNGSTVTGAVLLDNPGASWTGTLANVDLNGDGQPDLVVQNTSGTLVGFETNTAGSVSAAAQMAQIGLGWHMIGNTPMQFIDGTGANANLTATPGVDEFNLTSYTAGVHTITGFDPAQDSVALSSSLFPTFAAVQAESVPYNGGTLIALGQSAVEVIQGVAPSQLTSSNFVLR